MSSETVVKDYQVMVSERNKDIPARERWSYAPEWFDDFGKAEDWLKAKLYSFPKDGPNPPVMWIRTVYRLSKS